MSNGQKWKLIKKTADDSTMLRQGIYLLLYSFSSVPFAHWIDTREKLKFKPRIKNELLGRTSMTAQ